MPLTPENMETSDDSFNPSAIYRDIARMSPEQLEIYMRNAFTNIGDPNLPDAFFQYYFSVNSYGRSFDGREAPSPAAFLAGMHDIVGSVARGTFSIGDGELDFEFRPRFRETVGNLLDESLGISTQPTDSQKLIARFSVESVGEMQSAQTFIANGMNLNPNYPLRLRQDLAAFRAERPAMLRNAQAIIGSGRFGDLKLQY